MGHWLFESSVGDDDSEHLESRLARDSIVAGMSAPGFVVAATTLTHLVGHEGPALGRFVGFVAIFGLAIPQVLGSYWLWRSRLTGHELTRIAGWMGLGVGPITLLGAITIVYQSAHGVALAEPLLVLSWVAGVGATGGFLTGIYDVRRERQGRKLDDVSSRLETLAATAPVAIVSLDTDGTVDAWSGAATELFGYEREDVVGEAYQLVPEHRATELDDHFERLERGDALRGVETKRQCKDGSLVDVAVWATPMEEDGELTGAMVVMADIGDRKQREQRLAVLRRVLRHNLGNTADVIGGTAETLATELDDEHHLAHVERIRRNALELGDLGDKIREAERALQADENSVHLATMFDRERQVFEREFPAADVSFDADCDAPDPALTYPPAIQSALHEVVANAIEHSDRAQPTVRIDVARSEGGQIELGIADDGPGIPDHEREVLEREGETQLRHSGGVGLWLVNWLVTSVGGTVDVADNVPRGTVVTFDLPATTGRIPSSGRETASPPVGAADD